MGLDTTLAAQLFDVDMLRPTVHVVSGITDPRVRI